MNKKFFLCPGGPIRLDVTNRQAAAAFTDLILSAMTNHDYGRGRARRRH
jgi:hypothetical protein